MAELNQKAPEFRALENEIQAFREGPKQYVVRCERDGFTYIDDVWADSAEIVDGELRFYRKQVGVRVSRKVFWRNTLVSCEHNELIAAYSRGSWDSFGLADDPEGDPRNEYGVIDPRQEENDEDADLP